MKLVLNSKDKRIKVPNNADCFNIFYWSLSRCTSGMLMNGVLWVLKSTETKLTSKAQRGINSLVEMHLYPKSNGGSMRDM